MQRKYAAAEPLLASAWRSARRINLMRGLRFAPDQLGGSLLGQKKYAEAEPLVLTGYRGCRPKRCGSRT